MNTREMLLTFLLTGTSLIALALPSVSRSEATDVVAINVLAIPDTAMRDRARQLNEQLAQHRRQPFAFDETHVPHISVLHRFVAAKDLPKVVAAVEQVSAKRPLVGAELTAAGLERSAWNGADLVSIKVEKTPELSALQAELVAALRPFASAPGGPEAFVTSPGPAEIDARTIEYVQSFEQKQTGERFKPHITAGEIDRGSKDKLPPFADTTFTIETLAIYQLGNLGTARRLLWRATQ